MSICSGRHIRNSEERVRVRVRTTYTPFSGYEIDPSGVVTKYIRVDDENLASKKSGGEKLFYHNDHLGGVNVTSNDQGLLAQIIEYDPWGKISREEGVGDSVRRFTGKRFDQESGLYYYGGRYYDPELGRWISPDPFIQTMTEPQALNRYSYVLNNPVNYIDPDGFFFKKLFKKFFKLIKNVSKGFVQSLKTMFRKPGVFFATLGIGLLTAGLAYAAAPALGFATGSWQAFAFAGAVGGAAAGATGAAMTGGNIWQGALVGFVGGAVGGGVFGYMGGGVTGYLTGAFAGGAAAGGLSTAFYGGNFLKNALVGGAASFAVASGFAAARIAYNSVAGYDPKFGPGGEAVKKGDQTPPVEGANNVGIQGQEPGSCFLCEGDPVSRFLNRIPGINAVAGFHDMIVTRFPDGTLMRHFFGPVNLPTAIPAAAVSYAALVTTMPPHAYSMPYNRDRRLD